MGGVRTDVLSQRQRRYCMSRIRGRDTTPELLLRRELFRIGLRYRLRGGLVGRPDVVFPTERIAVFVDGCFWHRCPEHATKPATNREFWKGKLSRNVARDRKVDRLLRADGWLVLRFWEHDLLRSAVRAASRIRRAVARRKRLLPMRTSYRALDVPS
jgi:DNA mismatch endonuclease (patch repair protein)